MTTNSPLSLKPDFAEAAARWDAFWNGEMLDRPPVAITCPAEGVAGTPRPDQRQQALGDVDALVAQVDASLHGTYWGGDAMPLFSPSFGPDNFACFLGAELDWSEDEEINTSWAIPYVDRWEDAMPIEIQEDWHWWTRMLEYITKLAEAAEGKWLVSGIDNHSNMDALVSIRGATELALDLHVQPEMVEQAHAQVRKLFPVVYERLAEAGRMTDHGTGAAWISAYCAGSCMTIQCDFAALIGPGHFQRFVVPALEEEATYLDHCVYHWDGPTSLVHLDALAAIEGIDCIQWVPGSGAPPLIEWLDLLAEVQNKGKSVMVYCSVAELPVFHKALRPDRVWYHVSAPNRDELEQTLEWVGANS